MKTIADIKTNAKTRIHTITTATGDTAYAKVVYFGNRPQRIYAYATRADAKAGDISSMRGVVESLSL